MRAAQLHGKNGPVDPVFENGVPAPTPEPGDAIVRVLATGITPYELSWAETWERDGRTRNRPIPGREVVGVVEQTPPGSPVTIGEEVYGLVAFDRDGAAADYVAVPAADLARKPTSLDALHTATLPLSALTAWQAFTRHATLRPGQSVLIHGAGGASACSPSRLSAVSARGY
jgi:NADPH:quinone reductase-like Zn-dependent oxidoreductase